MYNAITDVPGIKVGHYTDRVGITGCTVVLCEGGATGGVSIEGAAPGTRETDSLRPMTLVSVVHGVLLCGGSAFGLDAAGGVVRYLEEKGIGFDTSVIRVPIVPAAVLFDLGIGSASARPGRDEGYKACLEATDGMVAEGCVGAGMGATIGKALGIQYATKGGLGTASESIAGGVVVAALAVVNAFGDVLEPRTGRIVAGARSREGAGFASTVDLFRKGRVSRSFRGGNTTLGVVATNARLSKEMANKVAQMAQAGIARTISPCHTMFDGDAIFALSTSEEEGDVNAIGSVAAEVMAKAIVRGVLAAESLGGLPASRDLAS